MVQLAVLVIALAAIFALKAVSIMKTHEELIQNSTSFRWASIQEHDQEVAASWATEEEQAEGARIPLEALHGVRAAHA